MKINDVVFNVELIDILRELQKQLHINGIDLLHDLKDTSYNIMVTCPYHNNGQERRPSAGIKKEDGIFHCFACNETHTLPEVISHCFGKDSVGSFGWKWLLQNYSTIKVEERKDVKLDLERNTNNRLNDSNVSNAGAITTSGSGSSSNNSSNNRVYIEEHELDRYRYIHPYMYKRKLTDEIIKIFDIGYDATTESITFPIKDGAGNVLFIARRSVVGKWFNYPSGVEKPLYGLYEYLTNNLTTADGSEVIVCESMLDALTCWVYGKYAVALNGLGNELQFKQLRELPCRKLILATDNDEAGMKARKRIRENIKNKLITEYILPEGRKDINELSKEEFDRLEEVF